VADPQLMLLADITLSNTITNLTIIVQQANKQLKLLPLDNKAIYNPTVTLLHQLKSNYYQQLSSSTVHGHGHFSFRPHRIPVETTFLISQEMEYTLSRNYIHYFPNIQIQKNKHYKFLPNFDGKHLLYNFEHDHVFTRRPLSM